jgi:RNA polymerase sigma-70 factor (family 1)
LNETTHTDIILLQRIADGDPQAFASVYHAYKDKLYSFLLRITYSPERSEDIVQEVFLRIWLNRSELTEVRNFNAYLFRAAHNHAISGMRRMAVETTARYEITRRVQQEHPGQPVDEAYLEKELQEAVRSIVLSLPTQQRKVYELSRDQGLKSTEIARELDIHIKTVETHLRLAMTSIRQQLTARYPYAPVLVILILATLLGD